MVILQTNSVWEIHSEKWGGGGVSGNKQTLAEGHQRGKWRGVGGVGWGVGFDS